MFASKVCSQWTQKHGSPWVRARGYTWKTESKDEGVYLENGERGRGDIIGEREVRTKGYTWKMGGEYEGEYLENGG